MIWNWFLNGSLWEHAEDRIRRRDLGKLAEISIQAVLPAPAGPAGDAVLRRFLSLWERRFATLLGGPPRRRHVLRAAGAVASMAQHARGPLVRLFADTADMGNGPRLDFEVVGKGESLLARGEGVEGILQSRGPRGTVHTRLFRDGPLGAALAGIPPRGRPVRLGVISLDHPHAAGNHFPSLELLPKHVRVVAIAEPDRRKAAPWLRRFGAVHYRDRDTMLARAGLDAVLVTSENHRHAADALAAATAGKDVFCDKPIATTLEDTLRLVRACRRRGVRFVTTYPCRFHPALMELRRWIQEGRLGRIRAICATNHGCMYEPKTPAWVMDPSRNGGGCMVDHIVHAADAIRWLTGREFCDVRAMAQTSLRKIPGEDIAVVQGRLTGGAIYQVDCSWSRKAADPVWGDFTLRVVGSRGAAWIDPYNNHHLQVFNGRGMEARYDNPLAHQHGMIFLDYKRARAEGTHGMNADAVDGLRSLELVFSAYDSLARGRTVLVRRYAV
jgi:predicted dehydrogenase